MPDFSQLGSAMLAHWPVWVVTITLVVAAVIDGLQLKVPNWITFPMILSGWVSSAIWPLYVGYSGWEGFGYSVLGTFVGLALLLPAYAVGGMGAGDVKLMAGIGAWVWSLHTLYAFAATALIGGVIAIVMVLVAKKWTKHKNQFWGIWSELITIRDPEKLAEIAAERKPRMMLLPYGIPIAIGSIAYFAWTGMLL